MNKRIGFFVLSVIFTAIPLFAQVNTDLGSVCTKPSKGGDMFSVGTVQISILREAAFQGMNGPEWVLMDGRSLGERIDLTPHISHLGNKIPDARGRFLRMADYGANVDPDGDRSRNLGSQQEDALQNLEGLATSISKTWELDGTGEGVFERTPGPISKGTPEGSHRSATARIKFDASKGVDPDGNNVKTDPYETRPANIAVNYFVKVCECRTANCK